MVRLLKPGERVGEMEIVKRITVLFSATIYQAQRSDGQVFLKVAHPGFESRLMQEAIYLRSHSDPNLPHLLPAYEAARVEEAPYGQIMFSSQPIMFTVYTKVDGTLLSDLLARNSQLWIQHTGSIVLSIAKSLSQLHQRNKLHLAIHPKMILIRYDKHQAPHPLLLDLGLLNNGVHIGDEALKQNIPLEITAPELLSRAAYPSIRTDVYGLGMLLYQMLGGRSAFESISANREEAEKAICAGMAAPLKRHEIETISEVCMRAIHKNPKGRYHDLASFSKALRKQMLALPSQPAKAYLDWQIVAAIVLAAFLIGFLLMLAFALPIPAIS